MSTSLRAAPTVSHPADGGAPARRAVVLWAWRLFRREWRQHFLIFALITVAVAATIVGSAVATNTPPAASFGFGSAHDAATFTSLNAHARSEIAGIERRFGRIEVIENANETIPGSISTYQLRAEQAHGPFSAPMLHLLSGRFPAAADEVAVTDGVATAFHLRIGARFRVGGASRRVVGTVENPQSLLDEFALVVPGQVRAPTAVTVLFDAPGRAPASIGANVQTPASVAQSNAFNPETISLAALVLGMILIALVAVGGFTVLAQRRLRAIGMLESLGATDRHVRLVVRANGTAVGVAGAVAGLVLGLAAWLAYRPSLEQSAHHLVGLLALPWAVVGAAMVLAVLAAYFAASRPARAITRVPIVTALSGRPAPPRQLQRSAVPGIVCLVAAFLLLGYSGSTNGNGNGAPALVLGILLLIPGLILLAPFLLSLAARLGRRAPIATRLALRDLARYRARSGSALAAISVGVLAAVIVILAASARYGNVLDYAGPNLAPNQLAVHQAQPDQGGQRVRRDGHGHLVPISPHQSSAPATATHTATAAQMAAGAAKIAKGLGAQLIPLESPNAGLNGRSAGRNWNGPLYVATPRLLAAFGIAPSAINPRADIVTARPGLNGYPNLVLNYGTGKAASAPAADSPSALALAHPMIQEVGALPDGTSAPNTLITEHALRTLHISTTTSDWLLIGNQAFTANQISSARLSAVAAGLTVESKNDQPTSSTVLTWATVFGIVIALGILGMSVGLVRSETASDLRTLAATGASRATRRALTAVTAGALGFLGALLGTVGGYVGMIGWLRSNSLNGGIAALANVPVGDLLLILLAMPAFAALVGWLFAGREPTGVARQPLT